MSAFTPTVTSTARTIVDGIESGGTPLWDYFDWWRDLMPGQYNHAVLMLWLQVTDTPADVTRLEQYLYNHLHQWEILPATPGGLKVRTNYSGDFSLKWAIQQCYLAMMYSDFTTDATRKTRFYNYAKSQMDYALGDNPLNMSFVIGMGTTWSQTAHHRGSHGWWGGQESITMTHAYYKPTHRHILYGALMAGPRSGKDVNGTWTLVDEYTPDVKDHKQNEVALDFNAGMQGVVAGLVARDPANHNPLANFPQPETRNTNLDWMTTDRQYFVVAKQAASTTTSVQIEGYAHNQSAWPAHVTNNLSFRYFFTLDGAATASNVTATLNSSQGGSIGAVTQWSGNVYYVQVTFPDTRILPNRIYQVSTFPNSTGLPDELFRRSVKFTLSTNSGTWDNSNDHSYSGMNTTSTIRPNIPVYDNGTLLEGVQPAQGTLPAAPTGLTATAASSSQINLSWADNAGNETGYMVERKTGSGGTWSEIASSAAANVTTYGSTGLAASTQYYYRVRAYNANGNSAYSNEANATTSAATAAGSLTGSVDTASTTANLTTVGTLDWAHWGNVSVPGLVRKSSGGSKISAYTVVGTGSVSRYSNDLRSLSWTDGSPTASSSTNKNGVYINSLSNGFKITVPADTTQRTVKVYVGGWGSGGTLTASLSDGSASNYVSAMSAAASGQYNRTFTLVYKAGSASQTLNIEWKMTVGTGNVTLNAAALTQ